jgi:amino acid adenylation domain-containing protein
VTPADAAAASAADPAGRTPPAQGDAAYIVYTSGSTGTPKAVVCEHGALGGVVRAQHELLGVGPGDRVAAIAPQTVDAHIFETTLAICSGAELHIADEDQRHPGLPVRRFLRARQVTVLVATPTTLRTLAPHEHDSLRLVVSAGEAIDPDLARAWAPGRRLVNAYGPTEATIWTTAADIHGDETEISLGSPIPGAHVEVVGPDLSPVGIGEVGELVIGGDGLARGYLNADDGGAFVGTGTDRLYRTGDRVARRADGSLVFVGRDDEQVKLGGLRMEPAEIRHHLLRHPAVRDAAIRVDAGRLVAYVCGNDGADVDTRELMGFMEDRLPFQMVPTSFVVLDRLPTTEWGKLDTRALPSPFDALRDQAPILPPRTATQERLVKLAAELLGLDDLSVVDDLFMLGLNSLLVARFIARINQDMGVELEPINLFMNPNITALAEYVDTAAKEGHRP